MVRIPASERVILALDVDSKTRAQELVKRFSDSVEFFKVGSELFTAAGPSIVEWIHERGKKVFLDLKYHDIPNTVAKAAVQATKLSVEMFNVHASGGFAMMKRTAEKVVETSLKYNLPKPKIVAVTVLTSISDEEFKKELGFQHSIRTQVKHLTSMALKAGLDGVVASAHEASILRQKFGNDFIIVTPGIRPEWMPPDDQKRTVTPREAMRMGASYIVVGRAVLSQEEPERALELILLEVTTGSV
ncbi:MAG: orotidine-5'-phosphate decarboxylase [Nitrospirae bacterium]|nr:MAG: orotidine-5'-phosphate decarboxylase [Nitrospirota bacterium]